MHKDLEKMFYKFINILQKDSICKGGWHFGSVARGDYDIYSDYDIVLLIAEKDFESFSRNIYHTISSIVDELLIFFGEDFNDNYFKNFCSLVRINDLLHQFDVL